ncbi:MAG: transporter substrate-binding domain-containing protein [Marinomonas sp.]
MKLNKKLVNVVGVGAFSLMAAGSLYAQESLRVGMECNYYPFNYKDSNGTLLGYDVDVAKGVTDILGADVTFVCQEWNGMIPALLANKFDLIVASMSITNSREKKIDFSTPYRISVGRLVGSKKVDIKLFDDNDQPIKDNFKKVRIGIERASVYANYFKGTFPEAKVVMYDGNETGYLDLVNGRVDMIMTNPMKAYLKFLSKEDGAGFEFKSPVIDDAEYFGPGVGIGMRKGQPELKARVDAAIKKLITEGKLTEYALKIFPFPIHNEEWSKL